MTAKVTASSDTRTILSRVQSSAYCRMLDEPMKVAASIGTPTSSDTRTIGSTSAMTVRAAQFMLMGSFWSTISRARAPDLGHGAGAGAGQPDVRGADTEVGHQVEEADLDLHRRVDAPTGSAGRRAASRR